MKQVRSRLRRDEASPQLVFVVDLHLTVFSVDRGPSTVDFTAL